MKTSAECIGGACDGVMLEVSDPDEPDDWPDFIRVEHKASGTIETYHFNFDKRPVIKNGERVYQYLHDSIAFKDEDGEYI